MRRELSSKSFFKKNVFNVKGVVGDAERGRVGSCLVWAGGTFRLKLRLKKLGQDEKKSFVLIVNGLF